MKFKQPELKPCPFCGSENIAIEYYEKSKSPETLREDASCWQICETPYWQICCDHCGAMTSKYSIEYDYIDQAYEAYFSAAERVIDAWNQRA